MTFLPILERELRVRARSRSAHWARFGVVLIGGLICVPQLIWTGPFANPVTVSRGVFTASITAAFLLCCGACFLTADVISSERREGTLGLLFLTHVRGFDVLLGKLASAGLSGLCALAACIPILMIPVLAGGVTGGEALRKSVVLLDTMFLALTAGLWASTSNSQWSKSVRSAAALAGICILLPGLVDLVCRRFYYLRGPTIGLLSPLGTLSVSSDSLYKFSRSPYWISLAAVHAVGWLLFVSAAFRLRREGLSNQPEEIRSTQPTAEVVETTAPRQLGLIDYLFPIDWRLRRQRGMKAMLWVAALLSLVQYGLLPFMMRMVGAASYQAVAWPSSLILGSVEGALVVWVASRFFLEARRTGELELLLTTPLGAREIISAQWRILLRMLRWPLPVMLVPILLQAISLFAFYNRGMGIMPWKVAYSIAWVAGAVDTVLNVFALCWLGLLFGLRSRGQAAAIVWAVSIARLPPFLLSILSNVAFAFLGRTFGIGYPSFFWAPAVLDFVFLLWLISFAKRHLILALKGSDPLRFTLRHSVGSTMQDAQATLRKVRHWTPAG